MLFNKNKHYYVKSDSSDMVKTEEELELLKEERIGKEEIPAGTG
jgi:DNA-directed RNA polymerase subunit H (RpoH/RPB5)